MPGDVQLGYHFCHGHERHHKERPLNAQPLVEIANALSLSLGRSLDWIHFPVQGDHVDVRFFETLGQLQLRPETQLYLGVLHLEDGVAGAKARIVAAQRFVHDFGVATDCGWGRHRSQDVADARRAAPRGHDVRPTGVTRPRRSHGLPGCDRMPDETGRKIPSTTSAPRTTTSIATAGTATSIRPSRSSCTC